MVLKLSVGPQIFFVHSKSKIVVYSSSVIFMCTNGLEIGMVKIIVSGNQNDFISAIYRETVPSAEIFSICAPK